jgi:NitT/TauT family transport system substrate-binding protein
MLRFFLPVVLFGFLALPVSADALKLGALKFGTVNWELETIKREGLDTKNGFNLEVVGFASGSAAKVAFQSGEVDVIVSDWIWVARQRAAGKDFVFIPYSKSIGGVVVAGNSPVQSLLDLKGRKIGIAGGPLDKSWLILRAYAQKKFSMDLKSETEQVFGAPPLLFKAALQGQTDATINFWHYLAKMKAKGFREILSVSQAASELNLNPDIPLLGYVFSGNLVRTRPAIVEGLATASRQAKKLLGRGEEAWEQLRGAMKVRSESEFNALKEGFRAGIPAELQVDLKTAAKFFQLMKDYGGANLVGTARTLPDGVFFGQ